MVIEILEKQTKFQESVKGMNESDIKVLLLIFILQKLFYFRMEK